MRTFFLIPALLLAGILSCLADLKFDSKNIELKAKPTDDRLEAQFKFKNTGKEAVPITKISIGCSCLSAVTDKQSYAPGESGTVDVVFKLGSFTGHQRKGLTIISGKQRTRLQVGVQIPNVITITPDIVEWQVGDEPEPKAFKVVVEYPDPINILDVVCKREGFTHELKTVKEGREFEIILTPKSTAKAMLGMLRITTDCKIKKHKTQMAFYAISRQKSRPQPAGKK